MITIRKTVYLTNGQRVYSFFGLYDDEQPTIAEFPLMANGSTLQQVKVEGNETTVYNFAYDEENAEWVPLPESSGGGGGGDETDFLSDDEIENAWGRLDGR